MDYAQPERQKLRRLGTVTLLIGLAWLTVTAYAIHMALPFNPIRLPLERWVHVRFWAPEGWAFFTRSPQEEAMLPFVRNADGQWIPATVGPDALLRNAFGLNRRSRAQSAEVSLLASHVSQGAYQSCESAAANCFEHAPIAASLKSETPLPTLCGQVGIAFQKPVPWAWAASGANITMPSRIVKLNVDCR